MTTAARNLHTLLEQVENSEALSVRDRWGATLEAEPFSTNFALRHAAVTSLWRETVGVIGALPQSATRDRRLAYADSWWRAIVMPEVHWGDGQRHQMIDQPALDILDATAEYLEQLDGGTQPEPPVGALDSLRTQAEEWIARVQDTNGLSRGLTASLLDHLNNLIWCIDNADRFGVAPVVAAAEQATGGLVRTAFGTMQATWGQHLSTFVAAITLIATGLTQTNIAIDQGQNLYQEITAVVQHQPDPDQPPSTT